MISSTSCYWQCVKIAAIQVVKGLVVYTDARFTQHLENEMRIKASFVDCRCGLKASKFHNIEMRIILGCVSANLIPTANDENGKNDHLSETTILPWNRCAHIWAGWCK